MKSVVLSLGSNLADRRSFIERAVRELSQRVGNIVRASSVRESESWGFISHPFLNQVVEVQTALSPEEVLQVTQQVEQELGRTEKSGRDKQGNPIYHDRTIDIDLLWYEGEHREGEKLTLPHPHIADREFILVLLVEIYGNQIVAPFEKSFQEMLSDI
ncbi:MAG: 2-amino-4-hydroxy-6-hydroxymethyldihydropteridine diphosphokinase [Bacteroidales bacterium]|nr:2-amino-4-hydroxy-6-hydroxymethyldihydropteridine diphosphokinase [Bacteroidales bacterium]